MQFHFHAYVAFGGSDAKPHGKREWRHNSILLQLELWRWSNKFRPDDEPCLLFCRNIQCHPDGDGCR